MDYGSRPLDEFTPDEIPTEQTVTVLEGTPASQTEAIIHEILTEHPDSVYLSPLNQYVLKLLSKSNYFSGAIEEISVRNPEEVDFSEIDQGTPIILDLTHGQVDVDFTAKFISSLIQHIIQAGGPLFIHTTIPLSKDQQTLPTPLQQLAVIADVIAKVEQEPSKHDSPYRFKISKNRSGSPMGTPSGIRFKDKLIIDTTEEF